VMLCVVVCNCCVAIVQSFSFAMPQFLSTDASSGMSSSSFHAGGSVSVSAATVTVESIMSTGSSLRSDVVRSTVTSPQSLAVAGGSQFSVTGAVRKQRAGQC